MGRRAIAELEVGQHGQSQPGALLLAHGWTQGGLLPSLGLSSILPNVGERVPSAQDCQEAEK